MNTQVFGCPKCQKPFQVSEDFAGQAVQCPSCATAVEIPASAFDQATISPPVPPQPPAQPETQEVFVCPACSGQFGITKQMYGTTVGCPHCQTSIAIKPPETEPDPETIAPKIVTTSPVSKRRRKKKSGVVQPKAGSSPDLFAPGFKHKKDKTPDQSSTKPKKSEAQQAATPAPIKKKLAAEKLPIEKDQQSAKPKPDPRFRDGPKRKSAKPPKQVQKEAAQQPLRAKKQTLEPKEDQASKQRDDSTSPDDFDFKKSQETENPSAPPIIVDKPSGENVGGEEFEAVNSACETTSADQTVEEDIVESPWQPDPIDHLLPPRFDVLDPTRFSQGGQEQFKVVLPDGKGGIAQLDSRVLRVEHEGEKVALRMLTAEEKKRRRLIQNIVAILIGIAVIAIAFSILL